MQVAKIRENKGGDLYTIAPDATIETAVAVLREHGIGALVVSSNGTTVDGIVSERDLMHCMADRGAGVLSTRVSEVMTPDVLT